MGSNIPDKEKIGSIPDPQAKLVPKPQQDESIQELEQLPMVELSEVIISDKKHIIENQPPSTGMTNHRV